MDTHQEIDLHAEAFLPDPSGYSGLRKQALSLERMRRFLDQAIAKGKPEIRFIHGKGSGALKEEVYRVLGEYKSLGDIQDFHPSFFNPGIVIVEIR